jgi:hypothetical protein
VDSFSVILSWSCPACGVLPSQSLSRPRLARPGKPFVLLLEVTQDIPDRQESNSAWDSCILVVWMAAALEISWLHLVFQIVPQVSWWIGHVPG